MAKLYSSSQKVLAGKHYQIVVAVGKSFGEVVGRWRFVEAAVGSQQVARQQIDLYSCYCWE